MTLEVRNQKFWLRASFSLRKFLGISSKNFLEICWRRISSNFFECSILDCRVRSSVISSISWENLEKFSPLIQRLWMNPLLLLSSKWNCKTSRVFDPPNRAIDLQVGSKKIQSNKSKLPKARHKRRTMRSHRRWERGGKQRVVINDCK